jgi:hypothetical protein
VSRKPPKITKLESTAFHEAGHAAAAFHLGKAVQSVSIVPDKEDGSLGHCQGNGYPDWFSPDTVIDGRARAFAERETIFLFAGPAAEARVRGRHNHLWAGTDHHNAYHLASHFCGGNEETSAYLAWLAARAKNLIHDPFIWSGVESLAKALLTHQTMTGRKARAAYRAGQEEFLRANGEGGQPAAPKAAGGAKPKRGKGKVRK